MTKAMPRVVCVGVYLADEEHTANHIARVLSHSKTIKIDQRWTGIARDDTPTDVPYTVDVARERVPKYQLINRMLEGFESYDWIIICDDDVEMAEGFADDLIAVANHANFALLQPARTLDSHISHPITGVAPGLIARRTRFVEIGPVVCIRADAAKLLLPFADNVGMGWGLDFIWPARMEKAGLRLGIIDAVPVAHRIRKSFAGYKYDEAVSEMNKLLASDPHLTPMEAFQVLEVF